MKSFKILVLSILVLATTPLAYADQHEGEHVHGAYHHSWQDADANKDGVISKDEFMARHQQRAEKMFSKLDSNKDGKVDQAEREAMDRKCERHTK